MARLQLSLACGDYDLLRPLLDGGVRPEGIELVCVTLPSPERHWRMLRHEEFDVCELSLASYLVDRDRTDRFTAIPVFVLRGFHHDAIAYHTGSGVREPRDLEGKRVGDQVSVTIPPEQAYGQRDERLVHDVPRRAFQGVQDIRPGMQFRAQGASGQQQIVTVVSVADD
ncbi:MAG: hypothetical protein K6U07_05130, partial [Firmicutes bacterium]|nr:hypothetical protein [Bacillota bacterium]